jgi:hypothetical protein
MYVTAIIVLNVLTATVLVEAMLSDAVGPWLSINSWADRFYYL